jgi:hypothetical protein
MMIMIMRKPNQELIVGQIVCYYLHFLLHQETHNNWNKNLSRKDYWIN